MTSADDVTVIVTDAEPSSWVDDESALIEARAAAEVATIEAQGVADLAVAEALAAMPEAAAEVEAAEQAAEQAEASAIVVLADAVTMLSERVARLESSPPEPAETDDVAPVDAFAALDEPGEPDHDETPAEPSKGRSRWLGTYHK